jgi:hypothetical protein
MAKEKPISANSISAGDNTCHTPFPKVILHADKTAISANILAGPVMMRYIRRSRDHPPEIN